ncbi:uncharacterized protein [Palaemon carinicauda]|uniref:uncharacterized protein n=1 Tax=Palaemon carinicauda TaxID=392227 RepID=UPI0035B61FDC
MACYFGNSALCAVFNCMNSRQSRRDLSFFRFPNDTSRCKQWINNCSRPDLGAKTTKCLYENYRVCAEHFENDQFMNKPLNNKLVWNAVPTLFKDPTAKEIQESKILEPLSAVPDSMQDCDDTMECSGFRKKWRNLKVDEVDMKLKRTDGIKFKKKKSDFSMEIGSEDSKYIVRGEDDDSVEESEGFRIIIKEEMEPMDSYTITVNKRNNCEVEGTLRTNNTEFNWKGTQYEEEDRKPIIFRTGEFDFVLVEGDLTPSALRYVLKDVQGNLVRYKNVIDNKASEKCRDANPFYKVVYKSTTGVINKFRTGETVPAYHSVRGKRSFMGEKEFKSKKSRTYNSGHFEFILVDGVTMPGDFEVKEESVEYTTSTEVDPLAD